MTEQKILYVDFPSGETNHVRKLAGIERGADSMGFGVAAVPREEVVPESFGKTLSRLRPVGCIVEASGAWHNLPPRLFERIPVVYLDPPTRLKWRNAPAVVCDNAAVAEMAFRELSAGHPARFAAVADYRMRQWNRERIVAFRALCARASVPCTVFPARRDEPASARSARLAEWLASLPRRSAVFAANDEAAAEVFAAARSRGIAIPQQLTIVGVDCSETALKSGRTGLSSVNLDFEFAGYLAAKTLCGLVEAARRSPRGVPATTALAAAAANSFGPLLVRRMELTRGFRRREQRILEAVDAIRREACDGLSAAALAARLPGSRKHLEVRFREAMGHSILDEILHVRLEKALALLSRHEVPIADIAGLCGFRTSIELRKLFRRRFGSSMRRWRADHV